MTVKCISVRYKLAVDLGFFLNERMLPLRFQLVLQDRKGMVMQTASVAGIYNAGYPLEYICML